jgi:hypothetical protein
MEPGDTQIALRASYPHQHPVSLQFPCSQGSIAETFDDDQETSFQQPGRAGCGVRTQWKLPAQVNGSHDSRCAPPTQAC